MKIKVLCRNPKDYVKQSRSEVTRLPRNLNPQMHPLEGPREYVRALNATKLERIFAKPFIASLSGHTDGIHCICKHPTKVSTILSGSCDGEIRVWSLASRECLSTVTAHTGFVRGLCMNSDGKNFVSVGDDQIIKQWRFPEYSSFSGVSLEPNSTILGEKVFLGMDHHSTDPLFGTCGERVDIWDESRSEPICSLTWGVDSISHIKFNPVETSLLASCASDRSIILYDIRQSSPLQRVVLSMRSNAVAWNPMEAFYFTTANEDSNLYTFDMRRLDMPLYLHIDHVNAVLDVDYSPTGKEFVTGSFDKTVRIFKENHRRSREVYHTKRMQKISCVKWTNDATYVLSGSEEMNIRIWKADASQKLGRVSHKERQVLEYRSKLREKYQHHPQIKRISRHRHVPRLIHNSARQKRIMLEAKKRKLENKRRHSKPGTVSQISARKEKIVRVED